MTNMHSRQISASQPDPTRPDLSPTFEAAPPHAPVRRNLFSAHLSRRPASSQSSPQSNSQSYPQTQPHPLFPPSPQRNASQTSPFASPPQLHPSFSSSYDPTISPNHPLSPKTSAALFPSSSIIAVDPLTGRPILPNIPTLPRQLRLSDDDDEDGEDEDEEAQQDANPQDTDDESHQHARAPSVHPYNQAGHDPFAPTPQAHQPPQHQQPHSPQQYLNPATTETDSETYAQQRYNSQLEDMMSRYRSREYSKHHPHPKGKGGAGKLENGTDAADEEKEELMGHLMGVLRREVANVEEEGWMFGDVERGVGIDGEGEGIVMGGGMAVGGASTFGGGMGERFE